MSDRSRTEPGRVREIAEGMSSRLRWPPFFRTIRFRLTVWYSSLLLVFGVAFVVALNIAVQLDEPSYNLEFATPYQLYLNGEQIGATTSAQPPVGNPRQMFDIASAQLNQDNIDKLRTWSLVGVIALAIASGLGGYVVSGVMLGPVRDITEVASEITASSLNQRINHQGPDDELKALADTFDLMIERLESSFTQQSQFVQDASHELRTPLAAIRTNIDVLEMTGDGTVEEYHELMETIRTQTDRLARLTEDLLLLARSEQEDVETEPVHTQALLREVLRELGPVAERRRVVLAIGEGSDATALAVPSMLYRCVINLADNAIKYSGEGATVTLSARQTGEDAEIRVVDTGPGISPEHQRAVFDRFYRVDKGRSRREGGSGLGLAIVKQLVETQGGTVELTSRGGHGTTFTLRFPDGAHDPGELDDLAQVPAPESPAFHT